jgi:hypothetical protein
MKEQHSPTRPARAAIHGKLLMLQPNRRWEDVEIDAAGVAFMCAHHVHIGLLSEARQHVGQAELRSPLQRCQIAAKSIWQPDNLPSSPGPPGSV